MQRAITWPMLSIICFCLAFISVNASCTKNQRLTTIHASEVAVNTTGDEFAAWDLEHQRQILAKATTREEALARLEPYWIRQRQIKDGFAATYKALLFAATQTDHASLDAALAAARDLIESVRKIMSGDTSTGSRAPHDEVWNTDPPLPVEK